MNSTLNKSIQPILAILMCFSLMVTFAERGLISSTKILNNKIVFFLGEISVPVYLIQNVTRAIVLDYCNESFTPWEVGALEFFITIVIGILFYFIKKDFDNRTLKNPSTKLLYGFAYVMLAVCIIIPVTLGAKNQYEALDKELLDANQFVIYYHPTENSPAIETTTVVTYGTNTKTMTVEELGIKKLGEFSGWKIKRGDTRGWRLIDKVGDKVWRRWVSDYDVFVLYPNGDTVSKTVQPGSNVHFYAQWE